jgi:hypothetical protein
MKFYILNGQECETVTMKGSSIVKIEENDRGLDGHSPNYKLVSFSEPNNDGVSIVVFEIFNSEIMGLKTLLSTHSKNVFFK